MSKIQDALTKARERGNLVVHPRALNRQAESAAAPGLPSPSEHARRTGEIARMGESRKLNRDELAEKRLIHAEMNVDDVVRAFKELRTKILQTAMGRNCAIVVSSVGGSGGATFVARNLAVAFALDETKTALLVECNLAAPDTEGLVPQRIPPGLTDYLDSDTVSLDQVIHAAGVPRLRVLPAGTKRGIGKDYFTSPRMASLLRELKQRYADRYIIIDAPPLLRSSDTKVLLDACDYALFVVGYGRATTDEIAQATKTVSPQKLLGVVFNDEVRLADLPWKEAFVRMLRWLTGRFGAGKAQAAGRSA
jgi:Mrp family chromosome partitioning ATPase